MPYARDQQSAAQTDKELAAAPGAERQIVVRSLSYSTEALQTLTLESGTGTLRWKSYLSAHSTVTETDDGGLFRCVPNESLTYTTTDPGEFFISVRYDYEKVAEDVI